MEEIEVAHPAGGIPDPPPAPQQMLQASRRTTATRPQSSLSQELRRRFESSGTQPTLPVSQPTLPPRGWRHRFVTLTSSLMDPEAYRATWRDWRDNWQSKLYKHLLDGTSAAMFTLVMLAVCACVADLRSKVTDDMFVEMAFVGPILAIITLAVRCGVACCINNRITNFVLLSIVFALDSLLLFWIRNSVKPTLTKAFEALKSAFL